MESAKTKDVLSSEDLQKMTGMKGSLGKVVSRALLKLLEIDKVNRRTNEIKEFQGPDFAAKVLEGVGASYEIAGGSLDSIPAEGGFITVSNHHYGSIDGLILCDTIGRKRSDYKLLTTFLLSLIPNLSQGFLPVNNMGGKNDARSINSIRTALNHIHDGGALGLFPAGICATWQKKKNRVNNPKNPFEVEDFPWAPNMMRLIQKSGLPVISIGFTGQNSLSFHLMGLIHPRLRTARLIHELFNKKGTHVKIFIGEPIPAEELAGFKNPEELASHLRSLTYSLCKE